MHYALQPAWILGRAIGGTQEAALFAGTTLRESTGDQPAEGNQDFVLGWRTNTPKRLMCQQHGSLRLLRGRTFPPSTLTFLPRRHFADGLCVLGVLCEPECRHPISQRVLVRMAKTIVSPVKLATAGFVARSMRQQCFANLHFKQCFGPSCTLMMYPGVLLFSVTGRPQRCLGWTAASLPCTTNSQRHETHPLL